MIVVRNNNHNELDIFITEVDEPQMNATIYLSWSTSQVKPRFG